MSPIVIGLLGLLVLLVLLFMGKHIGIAMALVGFFGIFFMRLSQYPAAMALSKALGAFKTGAFGSCSKESLVVIPMFTLMGCLCYYSGISQDLYAACYKWVSRRRGGLAIATEIACAFFGAICGSATATTASMGKICLPEMDRYGYKRTLTAGSISAGGTLGILIPPSVGFMLYGINAGVGVGPMFISGIIPGIILTICYSAVAITICTLDPEAGPKGPHFPMKEKLKALLGVLPVLVLFIMVLGGILFGWCSATEGGAIGAFGALIFMVIKGKFSIKNLTGALKETMETTAMIFLIMIGSDLLGQFFSLTGLSQYLAEVCLAAEVNKWLVLVICLGIYGILGCFVDSLPLIVLLTPIFLPIITSYGFDVMWFGVLMVMLMEFGLMTPPVGMCCYVMAGIAPDMSLGEVFKGTAPFLIGIAVAILIIILVPQAATWLPSFMTYG
ncbi:MAG: TRAP transporter large permease [Oscillospiraceae bacterium]|nr:TRAP transporter large permease [Oscillospiraceae bacterium]